MARELQPYEKALTQAKDKFVSIAKEMSFDTEGIFAMQAVTKTDFAFKTANDNPGSLRLAMINVASTGLTLNPAHGYAYLVPRDGAIVLDISYKGLIKIATDTGAILWARADLVFEKDEFTYHGPAATPSHVAKVFATDRGKPVGAYCIAKTKDGDILTEVMPIEEIEKIRSKSQAYAKKKAGPWVEWFDQMAKKAVIKRASKTWPYTDQQQRMLDAIELANQSEGGYEFDGEAVELIDKAQAETITNYAVEAGVPLDTILKTYEIEAIEALPKKVYAEVMLALKERAHAKAA